MAKKYKRKKQHFVPKLYLKNFSSQEKTINVFNVRKNQIINNAPYMDQCYENYFYVMMINGENKLSILESQWASIFVKIILDFFLLP